MPNIDERQLLEGIPEEQKKALQQKLVSDRNKEKQSTVRPVRLAIIERGNKENYSLSLVCRVAPSKPLIRRSSVVLPGTRPKTQDHVVTWFRESEAPRGRCRERDGSISLWFHGRTAVPQYN